MEGIAIKLKKHHRIAVMALYTQALALRRELTDVNQALDSLIDEYAAAYGLAGVHVAVQRDGEVYLVPKTGEEGPAEEG